jgi:uracil-DNA glycosylase
MDGADTMSNSFNKFLVKSMHGKSVDDLLKESPDALRGISAATAKKLEKVFNIKSISDLARNRYFHRALAILLASGEIKFDPGPTLTWSNFFKEAPVDYYVQHPSGRFRLDFGPVYYRGRLDGTARIIVVGQDPAANEILGHRIFVGKSGQRIQGFLKKLGITRSYTMLNMFLFSVFGQVDSQLRTIAIEEPIFSFRNAFLNRLADENPIEAIVTVGKGAQFVVDKWPGSKAFPIVEIVHPAAPNESMLLSSWNSALNKLDKIVGPDDGEHPDPDPYGSTFLPKDITPIPPDDLPFGMPEWHGDGSHGQRDGNKKIIWTAP